MEPQIRDWLVGRGRRLVTPNALLPAPGPFPPAVRRSPRRAISLAAVSRRWVRRVVVLVGLAAAVQAVLRLVRSSPPQPAPPDAGPPPRPPTAPPRPLPETGTPPPEDEVDRVAPRAEDEVAPPADDTGAPPVTGAAARKAPAKKVPAKKVPAKKQAAPKKSSPDKKAAPAKKAPAKKRSSGPAGDGGPAGDA